MFQQGIPLTAFAVKDTQKENERLKKPSVEFRVKPTKTEGAAIAVFDIPARNLSSSTRLSNLWLLCASR